MSNQNGTCTHIKVSGFRCGSPALRGEQFCYFHQNAHRGVRRPGQSRLHPIALIEDEDSIQYALMEVINALMRNTIDNKRATLILRALHIAVKNASRVKLGIHQTVRDIPGYAEPSAEHEQLAREAELPAVAANPSLPVSPDGPHYWEMQAEAARRAAREEAIRFAAEAKSREEARRLFAEERAREQAARKAAQAATTPIAIPAKPVEAKAKPSQNVGAEPLVRPAPPSEANGSVAAAANVGTAATGCPGREATAPAPARASASTVDAARESNPVPSPAAVPPHNFKPTPQPESLNKKSSLPPASTPPTPTRRKPPATVTAPKERKNAAHAARHG